MGKFIDLTGQEFGYLQVLSRDKTIKRNEAYWVCKCTCGNLTSVRGSYLREGITKSCGCFQKEQTSKASRIDLTGLKFGKLTVLKLVGIKDQHTLWECKCDCGNIINVTSNHIKNQQSCGCLKSKGEEKIKSLLREMGVDFLSEYSFPALKKEKPLRFDIYIPSFNVLIEYQGEQHYRPVDFFGGETQFLKQKQNDLMKKEFCISNNFKLVIIPYTDFVLLNKEYLWSKIKGEYDA